MTHMAITYTNIPIGDFRWSSTECCTRNALSAFRQTKLHRCVEGVTSCLLAGIEDSSRLLVLGSSRNDVSAVQNSRDLPGLSSIEREDKIHAVRRRRQATVSQAPKGRFRFQITLYTIQSAAVSACILQLRCFIHQSSSAPLLVSYSAVHHG